MSTFLPCITVIGPKVYGHLTKATAALKWKQTTVWNLFLCYGIKISKSYRQQNTGWMD